MTNASTCSNREAIIPTGLELPEGWKGAFLAAIGRGDTIEQAAAAAEIGTSTVYAQKTRDLEFAAEWESAKKIRAERRRDWVIDKLHEIAAMDDHKAQFAALSKLFDALPENRSRELALTGANGGPLEVTNPDVAAAIERFTSLTAAAIRAATREREDEAPLALDGPAEGAPGLPVGGMASTT